MRPHLLPLLLALAACTGAPGPVVPVTVAPVAEATVAGWVRALAPTERLKRTFRVTVTGAQSATAVGRGNVFIALPDSLRFDFRFPFGSNRGAAFVVGERVQWAQPEERVKELVPSYPLLWAMLGHARPPAPGDRLLGLEDANTIAWRYVNGADTVDYFRSRTGRLRLIVETRQAGKVIGRVTTTFGPDGQPLKARLDVPSGPTRIELEFTGTERPTAFPAWTWNVPADSL